jgi:hypothetical protein
METTDTKDTQPFTSNLGPGRDAFLSEAVNEVIRSGERSSNDFVRKFPCAAIMTALGKRPMERARIVTHATGMNEKVALKMTPEASGEALQIALDEKVTTTEQIVDLFKPDDRVMYMDREALWSFLAEAKSWETKSAKGSETRYVRAKDFVAYIVERALKNTLMTHAELLEALTLKRLVDDLPKEALGDIIAKALGEDGKFVPEHLFAAVPTSLVVDKVTLPYVWEKAVVPLIAERNGYDKPPPPPPSETKGEDDKDADANGSADTKTEDAPPASAQAVQADDIEDISLDSVPPAAAAPKG